MTHPVQNKIASVAGAELSYDLTGEGPVLVLAHAGVADRTMWDEQVSAFAAHYRVLRYDLRGYGKSPPLAEPFSHHQDLFELLTRLGVTQAHLIGCSNGGMVMTDFTLAHPELAQSLVLVSSAVSGYEFSGEPPETILALMNALGSGDLDEAAEVAAQIWVDGPTRSPDQVDRAVRAQLKTMSRAALKTMLPGVEQPEGLEPPALGRLSEITVPTLIILGDKDDPSILEIGKILHTDIGGAKKVVISGAAHMVNLEKPEAFNQVVLNFLASQHGGT